MTNNQPNLMLAPAFKDLLHVRGHGELTTLVDRQVWAQDNLAALAALEAGSARLVYLDPPFNSGRAYEALLGVSDLGHRQREAFNDIWHWDLEVEGQLGRLKIDAGREVAELVHAITGTLGRCDLAAYLVMIAPRLTRAHHLLADDGSLFLHCDPSSSHYLKILLDHIFGPENFRNEIIWKRTHAHSSSRRFGPVHDVILFYSRSSNYVWNELYAPYSEDYINKYFRNEDKQGRYQLITCTAPGARPGTRAEYEWHGVWPPPNRHWAWTKEKMQELEADGRIVYSANGTPRLKRYIHDGKGTKLQDLWIDINPLGAHSAERTGYETQKPVQLLERIIDATTERGDLVVDPFGGSGTTAVAAERLGRAWIIADRSLLASSLTLSRVRQEGCTAPIQLKGFPCDEDAASHLRSTDPTTYAVWGTSILSTLLNRRDTDPTLASGNGTWWSQGSRTDLLSWVPLTSEPIRRVRPAPQVDYVLILDAKENADGLVSMLRDTQTPVIVFDHANCTSSETLRFGSALVAA